MLVKAIQEACLKILEQEGPDQLTTQRIADVAGINIASLYQYFPNKEAVLAEVFEEQIRRYTSTAQKRFQEIDRLSRVSLEDTLAAIIDMEIKQCLLLHRMDPEFYRTYRHSFDIHRRINELTVSLENPAWEDWFPRLLAYHRDKLRSEDIAALTSIAIHALSGTILSVLAEDPARLEQEMFREELLTLLLSYLLA
jgi:AcrR family transcriptional regulator